jgi:3-isopropylmalate dehydrogenase
MLAYSFEMHTEATAINDAVKNTIIAGYRTGDIATKSTNEKIVGTKEFTDQVIAHLR